MKTIEYNDILDLCKTVFDKNDRDFLLENNVSLKNMGMDSLMTIHFITLLEDKYDIEIDGEILVDFSNKTMSEVEILLKNLSDC